MKMAERLGTSGPAAAIFGRATRGGTNPAMPRCPFYAARRPADGRVSGHSSCNSGVALLSLFDIAALLVTLTAAFAWLNQRFIRLPHNIGLLVMGLAASFLLIGAEILFPESGARGTAAAAIGQIDFYEALMHGALGFLLFAGALHVDISRLADRAWVVATMASAGVAVSTVAVGVGLWFVAGLASLPLSFAWALVFGALIAPTDPVAVLSTLREVRVPQSLETDMSGEALFNDGVGVVFFTILLEIANAHGGIGIGQVAELFMREAVGGALLGLATGYVAYHALRSIDDYSIEVMISLALVLVTYAAALRLHVSGPIAVVVAGILIGNRGVAYAMSSRTQRYLFGFWGLIDQFLNSVLFLLIGLEVLVLHFDPSLGWVAVAAVPLVILARFVSVSGAVLALTRWHRFARGTIPALTWGGVRGGISLALALSLPDVPERPLILAATYAVVLFSVIVQGLSLGAMVRRVMGKSK